MSFLEDLYYGEINLNKRRFDSDSEYVKLSDLICENEEKLMMFLKALPNAEKEHKMLLELTNAQNRILELSEFERFKKGFNLGACLMLEALN